MNIQKEEVQAYLAAIVDSSDDAIIGKNLEGIITFWNKAATRIFGYSTEEALGQHITLIIPPERQDEEFIIIGKVKSGQRVDHFETIRRAKDGRLIDISITVSPIRNSQGTIIGASKIARDITNERLAERTSAYLAAIVDSSDDAIISKNLDGTITSWNKSATRIFGYSPQEAIGQHISLIIPPERMNEEYTIIGKIKERQMIDHFQTVRKAKDGRDVHLSITVSPILNARGQVVGASKVARDISMQIEAQENLEIASRRKDEFLANMSHELRTPMNAVIGLAHLLAMSSSLSPKEKQYVTVLHQSAESLMKLINDLLDFTKIESGAIELDETEFDLGEILARTISMVGVNARTKGLPLRVSYQPSLRKYYIGDPTRLQQVFSNLLSNAVKFTHEGAIDVTVNTKEQGQDQTLLTIAVKDTGTGIPADRLPVIFDKFVQADSSITRKYGGSGLGLSICKGYIEQMGGSIDVRSTLGIGTVFTVTVPLLNSAREGYIESVSAPAAPAKRNVLIVDDHEPNVLVVSSMLDEMGYDYDIAANGLEAVCKFHRNRYDVILMDVQMPEMDGFASTIEIRAFEKENSRPPTPIVAMTAHVLERDKHRCLQAGMNDFIGKPFKPQALRELLQTYIPAGSGQA